TTTVARATVASTWDCVVRSPKIVRVIQETGNVHSDALLCHADASRRGDSAAVPPASAKPAAVMTPAVTAVRTPDRHPYRTTIQASAASDWKNRRWASGESPAADVPAAAMAVKPGPYTLGMCRQAGATRARAGSFGYSAGTCT